MRTELVRVFGVFDGRQRDLNRGFVKDFQTVQAVCHEVAIALVEAVHPTLCRGSGHQVDACKMVLRCVGVGESICQRQQVGDRGHRHTGGDAESETGGGEFDEIIQAGGQRFGLVDNVDRLRGQPRSTSRFDRAHQAAHALTRCGRQYRRAPPRRGGFGVGAPLSCGARDVLEFCSDDLVSPVRGGGSLPGGLRWVAGGFSERAMKRRTLR
ncbi:Uncharacterised protein [Mycobacteroides abscessus subsp. abscessus]|nr:Uncharacterised protein [Mycobacteroides abscessus subsp. abscessus]